MRASRVDEVARLVEDQFRAGLSHRMWVVGRVSEARRRHGAWSFALTTEQGDLWLPAVIDAFTADAIEDYLLRAADAAIEDLLVVGRAVRAAGLLRYDFATHQLRLEVSELDPATTSTELEDERVANLEWAGAARLGDRQQTLSPASAPLQVALVGAANGPALGAAREVLEGSGFAVRLGIYQADLVGEEAPLALVHALRRAGDDRPDVILLVRDERRPFGAAPFNARPVAEAIAASPVPVLTGITSPAGATVADEVAYQAHGSPAEAAAAVVRRLQHAHAELDSAARAIRTARDAALDRAAADLGSAARAVDAARGPAHDRVDAAVRRERTVIGVAAAVAVAVFVVLAVTVGPLLWLVGAVVAIGLVGGRELQRAEATRVNWKAPAVDDVDFTRAIERLHQIGRELGLTSSPGAVRRLEQEADWLVEHCRSQLGGQHGSGAPGGRVAPGGPSGPAADDAATQTIHPPEPATEVFRRDTD